MNSHLERMKAMEADARQSRKYSNRGTFFAIVLCVTLGFVVSGVTAVQARQQAGPNGPWALVLVRADQPLPRDFTVDLLQVDGVQVDKRIAQPLLRMLEDARQDGVTLELCGAYRSVKEQRALADALTEQLVQQGDSIEQGRARVSQAMQPPGASEHHTGLAVDFAPLTADALDGAFAGTPAYAWLQAHAAAYGFIERYPQGQDALTGMAWSPWHYRYVGPEHAKRMREQGVCLETYLQSIADASDEGGEQSIA